MKNKKLLVEVLEEVRALRREVGELTKGFNNLTDDMAARGEAADDMAAKANKMFEEGMAGLFGYHVGG